MTEPTTAAGRALLNDFMTGSGMLNRSAPRGSVAEQILAIEAEARQQDGSALRRDMRPVHVITQEHRDLERLPALRTAVRNVVRCYRESSDWRAFIEQPLIGLGYALDEDEK